MSSIHSIQPLHRDIVISSDQKKSSQASVFYAKTNISKYQNDELNLQTQTYKEEEVIVKIYHYQEFDAYEKDLEILNLLNRNQTLGFPRIISYKANQCQAEIMQEALGLNLQALLSQCPKQQFSKNTVLLITIQILERLQNLHSLGYVHNDLKLENIVIGNRNRSLIYLIDFGLSVTFGKKEDNIFMHDDIVNTGYFTGNFIFASRNSCRGHNKSRRDDIESTIYIMIYLLYKYLPWQSINTNNMSMRLKERLKSKYTNELFILVDSNIFMQNFIGEFHPILNYVLKMNFFEVPDYNYLITELKKIQQSLNQGNLLDWVNRISKHEHRKLSQINKDSSINIDNEYNHLSQYRFKSQIRNKANNSIKQIQNSDNINQDSEKYYSAHHQIELVRQNLQQNKNKKKSHFFHQNQRIEVRKFNMLEDSYFSKNNEILVNESNNLQNNFQIMKQSYKQNQFIIDFSINSHEDQQNSIFQNVLENLEDDYNQINLYNFKHNKNDIKQIILKNSK